MKNSCLVPIILGIILLGSAHQAFADGFSVGVYPPLISVRIINPTIVQTPIQLKNNGTSPEQLTVIFKSFSPSTHNDGTPDYINTPLSRSDKAFFQGISVLDNGQKVTTVSIAPQQEKTLLLQISAQDPLQEVDHYFSVLFEESKEDQITSSNSQIQAGIATNVLIATGQKQPQLRIESFSGPLFVDHGPVFFQAAVQNTGDHFATTQPYLTITNMYGQTIGKLNLLPVSVLAHSTRSLPGKNISPSQDNLSSIVWPEKVLFGPYKAVLHIPTQNGEKTQELTFIALPVNAMLILIIIVLFFLLVRRRLVKYLNS